MALRGSLQHGNLTRVADPSPLAEGCDLTWRRAPGSPPPTGPGTQLRGEAEGSGPGPGPGMPGWLLAAAVWAAAGRRSGGWTRWWGVGPSQTPRRPRSPREVAGKPARPTRRFGGKACPACLGPREACPGRKCCSSWGHPVAWGSASGGPRGGSPLWPYRPASSRAGRPASLRALPSHAQGWEAGPGCGHRRFWGSRLVWRAGLQPVSNSSKGQRLAGPSSEVQPWRLEDACELPRTVAEGKAFCWPVSEGPVAPDPCWAQRYHHYLLCSPNPPSEGWDGVWALASLHGWNSWMA